LQDDESRLIEQAQQGDKKALSLLLQRHYTFLVRYLIKVTLQPPLAEDLAQETMLRCMEKISLYNGQSKFSSWLMTIASRLYIDYIRRRKRESRILEQEQALRKLRWQAGQNGDNWAWALEALGKLNDEVRIPIVLKHYYGYAYEEIAGMLDIPAGTVKSRVHNGLGSLRKELEKDNEENA
jgi:RNA polymerase sigma-70 factor, ECF subfamily